MYISTNQTPHFGSLDAAPWVNLAAHLGESYRNNNQEAKLRQEIRQELLQPAQDRFVPNFSPVVIPSPSVNRQPFPIVRFGMLGMAVWNPLSGTTNDAGLSTFASNGGTPESLTLTAKEIEYIKAK